MDFKEYQDFTETTAAKFEDKDKELAVWALGLVGESGEYADAIKKILGHGHQLDKDKLLKELGDVLYYVARCAKILDSSLEEVAELNIRKLQARYPNGFSTEKSINRKE
jgi:NTP pyrophosphatase (non-canonical NTP hydrolase)